MVKDIIKGNLKAFEQFKEGTFQNINRLIDNYLAVLSAGYRKIILKDDGFYASTGVCYFMDSGRIKLAITEEKNNLLLSRIKALPDDQLTNYVCILSKEESLRAIHSASRRVFELDKLRLLEDDNDNSYLSINNLDRTIMTSEGYKEPYNEEWKFLDLFDYNSKNPFLIQEVGVEQSRIFFPKQKRIKSIIGENDALWNASWFSVYDGGFDIDTTLNNISMVANLCGVLKNPKMYWP